VYVHHYKKHAKRRSKDPTKFSIIVNAGGDPREYSGELSAGDPILKVCEFSVDPPEVRAAKRAELEAELAATTEALASGDFHLDEEPTPEEDVEEEPVLEEAAEVEDDGEPMDENVDDLPAAPDLDELTASEPEAAPAPRRSMADRYGPAVTEDEASQIDRKF
jgi:hypothetical protein